MTDILSSAGAALQSALTGQLIKDLSQVVASGPVSQAPGILQNSSQPMAISGTVASQAQNGAAVVQTAAGPLTISLPKDTPPLPQGTITVVIQPGNPQTASILAAQAPPPVAGQVQATDQTQNVTQTQANVSLPPLAIGQVLTATSLPMTPQTGQVTEAANTPQALLSATPPPPVAVASSASGGTLILPTALATATLTSVAVAPAFVAPPAADLTPGTPGSVPQTANAAGEEQSPLFAQYAAPPAPGQAQPQAQAPGATPTPLAQDNILAAQESASQSAPVLARVLPQSTPATPKTQSFVVLGIEEPDESSDTEAPSTQSGTPAQPSAGQTPATQGQPSSISGQPPPLGAINATVMAQTQSGQPVLSTDDGPMLVHQSVATSVGTGLVLQRLPDQQSQSQAPGTTNATGAPPLPLTRSPLSQSGQASWPALSQALTTLDRAAPQAAAFLQQAMPKLGDGFVQAFVGYLAAKAVPDRQVSAPVSDGMRLPAGVDGKTVAADHDDLRMALTQATADLAGGKSQVAARQDGWNGYQVPILTDAGIAMAQLFVHRYIDPVDDEGKAAQGAASTRFVVEISPSQIGPVQLDGLLRKDQTRIERLDLIVRTEFDVPAEAGEQMNRVFQASLSNSGMTGKLGFQSGRDRFVLPESGADPVYIGKV